MIEVLSIVAGTIVGVLYVVALGAGAAIASWHHAKAARLKADEQAQDTRANTLQRISAHLGHIASLLARPRRAIIPPVDPAKLTAVKGLACVTSEHVMKARSVGPILVAPSRCNHFRGRAIRMLVHADGEPSIEQRVDIGRVEINCASCWQNSGSTPIPSDVFVCPPGHAVAVDPIEFTTSNLIQTLVFEVTNNNSNDVRVVIEVYGEPVDPIEEAKRKAVEDLRQSEDEP